MSEVYAKPIIEDRFWIVEHQGERVATLRKNENNRFVLSASAGVTTFNTADELKSHFGEDFFVATIVSEATNASPMEVNGYPTKYPPVEPAFDVVRHLPLFKRCKNSKTLLCAGYYTVKFKHGWVTSFCPKLSTLLENEYRGPFKDKVEMRKVKTNESRSDYTTNH